MGLPRHRPTFSPRRRQAGTAACPHWGPEQGCRPAYVWRPTQRSVWPCSSALAIPSLVRKSYKLAVEEWKVGNQTGSFLEGVFLSFIMVFFIIITITVVSYFIMVLVLFFLSLSQRFHSFRHIPQLVFPLLPDSPGHYLVGVAGQEMGEGGPHMSNFG